MKMQINHGVNRSGDRSISRHGGILRIVGASVPFAKNHKACETPDITLSIIGSV